MHFINGFLSGNDLVMLYRNPAGVLCKKSFAPVFASYHKKADLTGGVMQKLQQSRFVRSIRVEGDWVRVEWKDHEARKNACASDGYFSQLQIPTFEGDVHPVKRFFSDSGEDIAKPLRAYLDIETDSRLPFSKKEEMRVLCWCLVNAQTGETITGVLEEDSDEAERDLLERFWKSAEPFDQLVAWNGDRFDFPVLQVRSQKTGAQVKDFRRWLYLDHLPCYKRMNLTSAESGDQKQSFKLQDVAMSLLGYGKDDFDSKYTWQEWAKGGDARKRLLEYNVRDTLLLRDIEAKTGYLELFQTLCEVCRVFPETRSLKPTVQMDGFMLRLGVEKGYHFPTKLFDEVEEAKYAGAYVMPPNATGIVKNVHVGDFKSLYPSIILTWNMSPETKGKRVSTALNEVWGDDKEWAFTPATGQTFRKDPNAILPMALRELLRLRVVWADKQKTFPPATPEWWEASRRSTAYKVAANSFYGVVGSPYSRFYDKDIAESITQTGAWLIRETMRFAESLGMRAVYGDTDSIFIVGVTKEKFREFVDRCNRELYPKLTSTAYENKVVLDYEKEFERIVFTSAKRYCGWYAHYKGKPPSDESEPEVKGLEYKRGDTPVLARRLQKKVIDLLCKVKLEQPEAFLSLLEKSRAWLLNATLTVEQVQISKSISKPLQDYTPKVKLDGSNAADIAHVAIAKELQARGEDIGEGTRVFYYVSDATKSPLGVKPSADYDGECDRYYLWESLVYPPSLRLLCAAFPEHSTRFESLAKARPYHKKVKPPPPEQTALNLGDLTPPKPKRTEPGLPAPFELPGHLPPDPPSNRVLNGSGLNHSLSAGTSPGGKRKPTTPYVIQTNRPPHEVQEKILQALHNYPGNRKVEIHYQGPQGPHVVHLLVKVCVSLTLQRQILDILNEVT